jgi:hypothetical protein
MSVGSWLLNTYVRPFRRDLPTQIAITVFIGSGVMAWAYAPYQQVSVPPEDRLATAVGTLDFEADASGRGGPFTVLRLADAPAMRFGCAGGKKVDRDCLPRRDHEKLRGKSAQAWWFPYSDASGREFRYLAKLEVDGRKLLGYEQMRAQYLGTNSVFLMHLVIFILGAVAVGIVLPIRNRITIPETRPLASDKERVSNQKR